MAVTSSSTKTVTNPHTGDVFTLVQCDVCGGKGTFWRPDIFDHDNCMKCAGWGCLTAEESRNIVPHPHRNDYPFNPRKGVR
jgi:DnaJ-class molecular chaperone